MSSAVVATRVCVCVCVCVSSSLFLLSVCLSASQSFCLYHCHIIEFCDNLIHHKQFEVLPVHSVNGRVLVDGQRRGIHVGSNIQPKVLKEIDVTRIE